MANVVKKTKGRQKLEMVRMAKSSHRQVTFSKRRTGLFKKASELCTLCGADIAIIALSMAEKPYSFGHPSVESVINRYLFSDTPANYEGDHDHILHANQDAIIRNLNMELSLVNNQIEIEKNKNERLIEMRKANKKDYWWDVPLENLTFKELEHLNIIFYWIKNYVADYINMINASYINSFMGINTMAIGNNEVWINPIIENGCEYMLQGHGPQ